MLSHRRKPWTSGLSPSRPFYQRQHRRSYHPAASSFRRSMLFQSLLCLSEWREQASGERRLKLLRPFINTLHIKPPSTDENMSSMRAITLIFRRLERHFILLAYFLGRSGKTRAGTTAKLMFAQASSRLPPRSFALVRAIC